MLLEKHVSPRSSIGDLGTWKDLYCLISIKVVSNPTFHLQIGLEGKSKRFLYFLNLMHLVVAKISQDLAAV